MNATTISKIISRVDGLKANAYSSEEKTTWINKVEGMIQSEIMDVLEDEIVIYDWASDADTELLVKHPHTDIYEYYLEAMIDYHNKEYSSYENSMIMFNNAYEQFSSYYKRSVAPANELYVTNIW